jgi:hypothetical protein
MQFLLVMPLAHANIHHLRCRAAKANDAMVVHVGIVKSEGMRAIQHKGGFLTTLLSTLFGIKNDAERETSSCI